MSSVLQVENINVYYGSIHAVKDVSFHVEQGEVVTLIGANGAGKSTTLNTVAGLLHSRTGSVRFFGEELRHVSGHKLVGRGMALVPEGRRIFQHMTVQENLDMGGYCRGGDKSADIDSVFARFPLLVEQIFDMIRQLHADGATILLVEQNAQAALAVADRGYVLETGRIVTEGTGTALLESDAIRKAYLGG